MTREESVVRRWWREVWDGGNLDAIDDLLHERYVRHDHHGTREFSRVEYKKEMGRFLSAVSAAETTVDDIAVAGDRVWSRITTRGVNLEAEQATTITWIQVHRVEADRLAEVWVFYKVGVDWG